MQDFTTDVQAIFDKYIGEKKYFGIGKEINELAGQYGISEKTAYNRIHSLFGCSPRDYITDALMPSKAKLTSLVLNCSEAKEVKQALGLPIQLEKGIYDKYFGVSNFKRAKCKLLAEHASSPLNPTRADNFSLLISQRLGDGSFDWTRSAVRIVHGIKQAEYLKFKVSLFNRAFPQTSHEVKIHDHKQGHQSVGWYSGSIRNSYMSKIEQSERHQLISELTPLGWLLWYFDDGHWAQNLSIASVDEALLRSAVRELKTYGIEARVDMGQSALFLCGMENDVKFYTNFIAPYKHIIPQCMSYKIRPIEDIVGN